ncbi:LexA repressor [Clostridiales bacterium]|nr:LexA repressor [Clostridiales bacterium]
MDSCIGKRIRLRREELNMSQEELATLMKYKSRSSINKIELGKTDVSQSKISEFARALKTTPANLMGWQNSFSGTSLSKISNIMPLPYDEGRTVPLIGTIACGAPILASENFEENIPLPDNVSADFCLRCKGDSMINARIYDGDIVFIRSQPTVENGEIAAVLIDEMADFSEATLKRVYIYDSQVVLVAENSQYSPMAYSGEEMNSVRIVGKAVAFLSSLK